MFDIHTFNTYEELDTWYCNLVIFLRKNDIPFTPNEHTLVITPKSYISLACDSTWRDRFQLEEFAVHYTFRGIRVVVAKNSDYTEFKTESQSTGDNREKPEAKTITYKCVVCDTARVFTLGITVNTTASRENQHEPPDALLCENCPGIMWPIRKMEEVDNGTDGPPKRGSQTTG